jgi:putative peptidoglycan lipid II flippase
MVGLNLILNLTLIWFLREGGLALATAISATVQIIILFAILQRKLDITGVRHIFTSTLKILIATFFMFITCWITLKMLPIGNGEFMTRFIRLFVPLVVALITFFIASFLLKSEELKYLYTAILKRKQ